MLKEQMLGPHRAKDMSTIETNDRVEVDLTDLITSKGVKLDEASVTGIVIDSDSFHGLITVKLEDKVQKTDVILRVPAERIARIER